MSQFATDFRRLDAEMWLQAKIAQKLTARAPVFEGDTTAEERRERFRQAIIEGGLEVALCGTRDGKNQTFCQVFERLFGTPLHPVTKRSAA